MLFRINRYCLLLFVAVLLMVPVFSYGQEEVQLGGTAYASILTCGPGDEFYETFGHSALRICDTASDIDLVFNYGIFDFDEPFFYLKFAQGTLKYRLAVQRFENFIWEYDYYGRSVWEQRVNLTHEELERLFALLLENGKPENMYYNYDFFRDNCATRVDEIITKTITITKTILRQAQDKETKATDAFSSEHELHELHESSGRMHDQQRTTYRDLLYKYNVSMPWWQLGTDILLGARCDRPLSVAQCRYIPMEMMTQYDTMHWADGSRVAGDKVQLLTERRPALGKGVSPTLVMWVLFFIIAALTLYGERRGWRLLWLDGIMFAVASFIALLLIFLWFGSDHWCTKWNMNLLWANPLLLWPLFRLRKPRKADSLIVIACLLVMIVSWPFGLQHFNGAVMPIALMLLVRLSARLKRTKTILRQAQDK